MEIAAMKKDFDRFKDDVLGVLLFGSRVGGEETMRSDIDVCIVKPASDDVVRDIEKAFGGKYDQKVFEKLPLYIQIEIINNHVIVYGDAVELSAYFRGFRKLWEDMVPRIRAVSMNGCRFGEGG